MTFYYYCAYYYYRYHHNYYNSREMWLRAISLSLPYLVVTGAKTPTPPHPPPNGRGGAKCSMETLSSCSTMDAEKKIG